MRRAERVGREQARCLGPARCSKSRVEGAKAVPCRDAETRARREAGFISGRDEPCGEPGSRAQLGQPAGRQSAPLLLGCYSTPGGDISQPPHAAPPLSLAFSGWGRAVRGRGLRCTSRLRRPFWDLSSDPLSARSVPCGASLFCSPPPHAAPLVPVCEPIDKPESSQPHRLSSEGKGPRGSTWLGAHPGSAA